jgi:prefoldin subunit 5
MFDRVQAGSIAGMDLYDGPMDIDDLAFMSLICCLDESTQALMERMREIRDLNGRKRALNAEIERLTQALNDSDAKDDDDEVDVPGGLQDSSAEPSREFGQRQDPITTEGEDPSPANTETAFATYTRKEVQEAIESLRRQIEDLSTSSEIMLIDLNRLMSRRNEAITLTSNILSTCHQSAMSVIANFKG